MDRATEFLDTLHSWYQAGEPATGTEVTPVSIDLASVRAAYHQLDDAQRDAAAIAWSHFVQACDMRPPNRDWVWQAIEDLALALKCDGGFEEPYPTEKDVERALRVYSNMHKDVYGRRPESRAMSGLLALGVVSALLIGIVGWRWLSAKGSNRQLSNTVHELRNQCVSQTPADLAPQAPVSLLAGEVGESFQLVIKRSSKKRFDWRVSVDRNELQTEARMVIGGRELPVSMKKIAENHDEMTIRLELTR